MYDAVIIGAGVVGCAAARELSRYALKTCVLEKGADVAAGTTKANSAIIHAGFDAVPGTLKAQLNARSNSLFDSLAQELDFPFKRNGSLVVSFSEQGLPGLRELAERGRVNGVPGLRILDGQEARAMEPHLSAQVTAALYAPTSGIVCPYEFTIALAENAFINGVEFRFDTQVTGISRKDGTYVVETDCGETIETRIVINAAGLYADEINNRVSGRKIRIIPRRGEYCLFDRAAGNLVQKTIFQLPSAMGKGVLVTPTVDGNLLMGPTAADQPDKADTSTTPEGLESLLKTAAQSLDAIPSGQIITSFAGLRSHPENDDFIIGEAPDAPGFINAAGIESPGLSCAPAIGQMLAELVAEKLNPALNQAFNPIRKGIPKFRELDNDARSRLIAENPAFGKIICRCETVTEGEILDAIHRPLGATTLDGVKRRTRAGMGRCQSGFCSTRVLELLARELKKPYTEITKSGGGSYLLVGLNKHTD